MAEEAVTACEAGPVENILNIIYAMRQNATDPSQHIGNTLCITETTSLFTETLIIEYERGAAAGMN